MISIYNQCGFSNFNCRTSPITYWISSSTYPCIWGYCGANGNDHTHPTLCYTPYIQITKCAVNQIRQAQLKYGPKPPISKSKDIRAEEQNIIAADRKYIQK